MLVCTCNPSYSGGRGRRVAWTQEAEVAVSQDGTTALQPGNRARPISKERKKERRKKEKGRKEGSQMLWWHSTCSTSCLGSWSRRSLESGRLRLQWAMIALLHSSLGDKGRPCLKRKKTKRSRVLWFMPVISALWEAEASRSPDVRSSRAAWATWWNPVSTKNTKISQVWWWGMWNPSYSGGWSWRIAWTQEVEVAVSGVRAIALQPEWQEQNSVSKIKKEKKKENNPPKKWTNRCWDPHKKECPTP